MYVDWRVGGYERCSSIHPMTSVLDLLPAMTAVIAGEALRRDRLLPLCRQNDHS